VTTADQFSATTRWSGGSSLPKGGILTVTLGSNPAPDLSLAELASIENESVCAQTGGAGSWRRATKDVIGAPGVQTWTFEGAAAGNHHSCLWTTADREKAARRAPDIRTHGHGEVDRFESTPNCGGPCQASSTTDGTGPPGFHQPLRAEAELGSPPSLIATVVVSDNAIAFNRMATGRRSGLRRGAEFCVPALRRSCGYESARRAAASPGAARLASLPARPRFCVLRSAFCVHHPHSGDMMDNRYRHRLGTCPRIWWWGSRRLGIWWLGGCIRPLQGDPKPGVPGDMVSPFVQGRTQRSAPCRYPRHRRPRVWWWQQGRFTV
jgi:hypothetical protein